MAHSEGDPEFQNYLNAFRQALRKLGWLEGRNIRIETRWGALDDAEGEATIREATPRIEA